MFCENCGKALNPGSRFCKSCGASVGAGGTIQLADASVREAVIAPAGAPPVADPVGRAASNILLWSPGTAASLSVLLTGAFGAYIHARNWESLGNSNRAAGSRRWMWAIIIAMMAALIVFGTMIALGVHAWSLIFWYFISGRSQNAAAKLREPFTRKGWAKPVLTTVALSLLLSAVGVATHAAVGSSSKNRLADTASNGKQELQVGEAFRDGELSITVDSVRTATSVGGQFMAQSAAEGGLYVIVDWHYKNEGNDAVSPFSTPDLKLIDASGNQYDPDIAATVAYATSANVSEKVLSPINPGITIKTAEAFEVSREHYEVATWKIRVIGKSKTTIFLGSQPATRTDTSQKEQPPPDVSTAQLQEQYIEYFTSCWDNSPDEGPQHEDCGKYEAMAEELKKRDVCFGPDGNIAGMVLEGVRVSETDATWVSCDVYK